MNFKISLDNLTFFAYHGVLEEERKNGNEFHVSLSVSIPYTHKIDEDELQYTVSYADLYKIIDEEMQIPRNLLEKLALEIVRRIEKEFPVVTSGKLVIEKLHPPIPGMLGSASVTLNF